jgi:hypothetical protein
VLAISAEARAALEQTDTTYTWDGSEKVGDFQHPISALWSCHGIKLR